MVKAIRNLDYIRAKDPRLYEALSDLVQQHQNIAQQVNGNGTGEPLPPPPIDGLTVTGQNGLFHVQIQHRAPIYRGIQYYAEFADNAGFSNPHVIHMGDSREHTQFLGNGTYFWRGYSSYASSPPSAPAYHGGAVHPQPVSGGGTVGGPALLSPQGSGTGLAGEGISGPGPVAFRSSTGKPPKRGESPSVPSGSGGGGLRPNPTTGLPIGMGAMAGSFQGGAIPPTAQYEVDDAATNSVATILSLIHRSSGTPAAGFGASLSYQLDSSTNVVRRAGFLDVLWTTATNANESADFVVRLMTGGVAAAEAFRVTSAGQVKAASALFSGSVGIGGAVGAGVLDVFGTGSQSARFRSTNATQGYLDIYDSTHSAVRGSVGYGTGPFSGGAITDFGMNSLGALKLASNNGAVGYTLDTSSNSLFAGTIDTAGGYKTNGTFGVASFGPAAVTSITVQNGIITAIS